jgi:hypothetical protein
MMRSVLAVLTGTVTIGVLAVAGDAAMRRLEPGAFDANGFSDNVPVLLVAVLYTTVFSAVGGWITAAASKRKDLRDVFILAGLQFVMTAAANVMLFDRRILWFYVLGLVLTVPAIVAGGRVRTRAITAPARIDA